ncbi:hypothetical protein NQ317_008934 [Molorchus minor]|uniref:Uncharacterized protein n=1 Tax=Molorchus minor TaxID=1323400 RepID=A0ABQ9JZP4_9CUCU|nr:hypothetical protein NQ317_008934 [Molorchus minor]
MRRQTEINLRLCDYEKLNRNLEEALKDNEKLKGELEAEKNKHKKLFDIDITPSEGSRNMSFERQQISIERLKEKLEMVVQDEKLAKEKLKQVIQEEETLQERYVKIQSNLESERAEHLSEKESFQNIIRELSDKLKATEDNQTELKRLLTEKEEAFSLQLSLLEQQNKELYAELENKNILINSIRNENETYKGLISNADRNTQDTLSKLSACLYKIQEKENAVQLLHAENAEKNNKVMYLMSRIADLQTEVTKIRADLSKKNDTIIDLEDQNKCLQEMLSKSDDLKKHELINTEEKLKDTNRILRESENELGSVQNSIAHATEELDRISDDVAIYKNVINDGRRELTRVSHLVLRNWQGFKADAYDRINFLIDGKVELEEGKELLKLNDTIKFAVFILETLGEIESEVFLLI